MLLQATKKEQKSNESELLLLLPCAGIAVTGDSVLVSVETESSQKKRQIKLPCSD
jgi:hypothetical protein